MQLSHFLAFALSLSTSAAVHQGFNYGSTKSDGSNQQQSDFQALFQTAKSLVGTSGFNSARLYTMIQGGTSNTPISAIPAAIAEDTTLLLGIWCSAGQAHVNDEIAALKSAISEYGSNFTSRVVAISVGSEDLYRNSVMGIKAKAGIGANPDAIASYVQQVRSAISGTGLSQVPIGHVDTWTAWVNGSNDAVIEAVDWLGVDAYPYFQNTMANPIQNGKSLFEQALSNTEGAAGGKEVWVTETGWPVSGKTENQGVPSIANAQTYWDEVGCSLFGKRNTYWYTLQDADPVVPNPSFGIVGSNLSTTPLFNLTCPVVSDSSSSSSASGTSSSGFTTSPIASPSGTGSASGSGSGSAGAQSSATAATTGKSSAATGAASTLSASLTGAVGAIIAAVALL